MGLTIVEMPESTNHYFADVTKSFKMAPGGW